MFFVFFENGSKKANVSLSTYASNVVAFFFEALPLATNEYQRRCRQEDNNDNKNIADDGNNNNGIIN